jgi:hypothetical protein
MVFLLSLLWCAWLGIGYDFGVCPLVHGGEIYQPNMEKVWRKDVKLVEDAETV